MLRAISSCGSGFSMEPIQEMTGQKTPLGSVLRFRVLYPHESLVSVEKAVKTLNAFATNLFDMHILLQPSLQRVA